MASLVVFDVQIAFDPSPIAAIHIFSFVGVMLPERCVQVYTVGGRLLDNFEGWLGGSEC
jgi:hypothetical protein